MGLTTKDQELEIAGRALGEVLCGSAAERLVGWNWQQDRGADAEHRGESVLSFRTRRGAR
jgi:hypothetical protein